MDGSDKRQASPLLLVGVVPDKPDSVWSKQVFDKAEIGIIIIVTRKGS